MARGRIPTFAGAVDKTASVTAASQPVAIDNTASSTGAAIAQLQQTLPITINDGGGAEISGASSQAVTFEGTSGTLKLDDATAFTGQVSGLSGSDAFDLADVSYGLNTTASFSGNASGGTLTVTNGSDTARIALLGDYLNSGWTLSSDGHGGTVVVDPTVGSGYPNATNTGIQAGTNLVAASSNVISQPGTYSGLDFTGPVLITASNVTLVNCLITMTPGDGYGIAVQGNSLTNVVIQNCEIAGNGPSGSGETYGIVIEDADGGGTATGPSVTINGCNIHDVGAGIEVEQSNASVIENNYIHISTSNAVSGDHVDGIFYDGGSGSGGGAHGNNPNFSLLIQGNTIINSSGQTDAVFISTLFGSTNDVTINNNLLAGGDYPVYVTGNAVGGSPTNITITNNALGTGQYGYFYTDLWNGPGVDGNVEFWQCRRWGYSTCSPACVAGCIRGLGDCGQL